MPALIGRPYSVLIAISGIFSLASASLAAEPTADRAITLGQSGFVLHAPGDWQRKEPSTRIVEHEFAVPSAENAPPGRVTVMGAGGSVEANIDRWIGQFSQPDGGDTKKLAKIEHRTIAGQQVHFVDISGTFKDSPGPFSSKPAIDRPDYRMIAAIVATQQNGNYFIKFYGPTRTVADHEKEFREMVEGLAKK
jgi:hypothetical protein